jgi:LPXTG-motif cell wall-anchored protein
VQLTSSPRRALGLLAAGTLGLSTALVGIAGGAQAGTVPNAPTIDWIDVGETTVDVYFDPNSPDEDDQTTPYADKWEYDHDGDGDFDAAVVDDDAWHFQITGLTTGATYSITLRGVDEDDDVTDGMSPDAPGATSAPVSASPAVKIGAPSNIAVTTGPGTFTVTWAAPTVAGTHPVGGYEAGYGQEGWGDLACKTAADVFTCTGNVDSGQTFTVGVSAIDTKGNRGIASAPVSTGVIPYPTTVPASNGPLTPAAGSSDKVVAGKTMTVSGTGYMPGSTVTVLIYSAPQILSTVVADASGNFTATVTVPAGLAPGQHTLVASGYDTNGDVRYTTMAVTVSAGGAATVSAPKLANTGADVTVPALGGIATLGLGAGLIVLSRRRRTAA